MPQTTYAAAKTAKLAFSPRLVRLLVVVLLVVLAVLLFASVRQESQVFDEGMHLVAGFEYWKRGDFGGIRNIRRWRNWWRRFLCCGWD